MWKLDLEVLYIYKYIERYKYKERNNEKTKLY
jgi:hypothetical protein